MLDIHTHILPEMDDGSKSVRQSIAMLRREKKQDINRVVFTPHFYANRESPEQFLKRRNRAVLSLEEAVAEMKSLPDRFSGAEVAFFTGMSRVDEIEQLCIGDTQAMLIEMPFCSWNRNILDEIDFLREYRGIRPVIAHVERYMGYQRRGTIRQMCDSGIWIQVNTSFFLKWQTAWMAMHMLKKHEIHFIGSDCHDTKRRPPNLESALSEIDRRLGTKALMYLEHMEQRLLEGE